MSWPPWYLHVFCFSIGHGYPCIWKPFYLRLLHQWVLVSVSWPPFLSLGMLFPLMKVMLVNKILFVKVSPRFRNGTPCLPAHNQPWSTVLQVCGPGIVLLETWVTTSCFSLQQQVCQLTVGDVASCDMDLVRQFKKLHKPLQKSWGFFATRLWFYLTLALT